MKSEIIAISTAPFKADFLHEALAVNYTIKFVDILDVSEEVNNGNQRKVIIYLPDKPDMAILSLLFNRINHNHITTPLIVLPSKNTWLYERFARLNGVFYFRIYPCTKVEIQETVNCALKEENQPL